jgi:hypothetical protein
MRKACLIGVVIMFDELLKGKNCPFFCGWVEGGCYVEGEGGLVLKQFF